MIFRSISLVGVLILIIAFGCSTGGPKPGTSGTTSAKKIEKSEHPPVPDGVNCYVCHKREIPGMEFHKKFGNKCEDCHIRSTWMAAKYPHPAWLLTGAHNARCTRCHTQMADFVFTYQCWGCHHEEKATEKSHADRGVKYITNCIECHKEIKLSK
jgi:hypothetical protein